MPLPSVKMEHHTCNILEQRRTVGRVAAWRTTKTAAECFLLDLIAILAVLARERQEEHHRW